jgi:hypothetical protein
MNRLESALVHLNKKMENHTDEDLYIGTSRTKVRGTLVAAAAVYNSSGIKITSNKYKILIVTTQLEEKQVQIIRGTKIVVGKRTFEVVIDNDGVKSPEEQYNYRTVITCKAVEC